MTMKPSVLFLEKVFLKRREGPVRGVEIFNLNLLRDLQALGCRLTVPLHVTWRPEVGSRVVGGDIRMLSLAMPGGPLVNSLLAALALGFKRHDVLLLANVANGLIPALRLLHLSGAMPRTVLIAHREPSARFVRAQRRLPTTVVAVNRKIASHFTGGRFGRVDVCYGVTGADSYSPRPSPAADDTVRFCVLGQLDNPWKGADTAVAAFRLLPAALRARCELHLASYSRPPVFPEQNVRPYAWLNIDEIPALLRRMDVLVVPSRDENVMRETFSQAMVQGMLTGLPVVANDLPVLTEKLDAGGGVVFRTVQDLADAMGRLAESPELRRTLGRQALQTARARYVWNTEHFAREYLFPGRVMRGAE